MVEKNIHILEIKIYTLFKNKKYVIFFQSQNYTLNLKRCVFTFLFGINHF